MVNTHISEKKPGILISTEILFSKELDVIEKLLLGAVDTAVKGGDECVIPQFKFENILNLSEGSTEQLLNQLVEKGYIEVKPKYDMTNLNIQSRVIKQTEKFKNLIIKKESLEECKKESEEIVTVSSLEENHSVDTISRYLSKNKYERLSKQTLKLLLKEYTHISEKEFDEVFERISVAEKNGKLRNFEGVLIADLQGKWFGGKCEFLPGLKEEGEELFKEKLQWFNHNYGRVNTELYGGYLRKISFSTLKLNGKRLGKCNNFLFKIELKKLIGQ